MSELKTKDSEKNFQAILDKIESSVVVLDNKGIIEYTNQHWDDFASENGLDASEWGEGTDYIEVLEKAVYEGSENAAEALSGLNLIFENKKKKFELQYPCEKESGTGWFKMEAQKLNTGAIIFHIDITESKLNEQLYSDILNTTDDMICRFLPDTTLTYANQAYYEPMGYTKGEVIGKKFIDFIPENQHEFIFKQLEKVIKLKSPNSYEHDVTTKNGMRVYQRWTDYPIVNSNGEVVSFQAVGRDITDLVKEKNKYEALLKTSKNISLIVTEPVDDDGDALIKEFSPASENLFGYKRSEIVNQPVSKLHQAEDIKRFPEIHKKVINGGNWQDKIELVKKDGSTFLSLFTVFPYELENGKIGTLGVSVDLSRANNIKKSDLPFDYNKEDNIYKYIKKIESQQQKIKYLEKFDELTGIYNRNYIEEKLKEVDISDNLPFSIILLDIDGLEEINNIYGLEKGDRVLKKIAENILSFMRKGVIVGRWGGDEFIIVLLGRSQAISQNVNQKIKTMSSKDLGINIPVFISSGIATKYQVNEDLCNIIGLAEKNMDRDKLLSVNSTKYNLVQSFLITLATKSEETQEHSERMEKLAVDFANHLNLNNNDINKLKLLAYLHDIGKVNISSKILNKPENLTAEEWKIMQGHSEIGYKITSSIEEFVPIADYILSHHEHWDGSGYPYGLEGEQIPYLSRVIAIIDAFDVMTNGRKYQASLTLKEALTEIRNCAGSQFDPELAKEFVKMIN